MLDLFFVVITVLFFLIAWAYVRGCARSASNMTSMGLLQIFLFFLVLLALTKPLGAYMARLFEGERTFLHPVMRPLERLVYRIGGVDESAEQHWTHYAGSLLAFSLTGILLTYLIQRIQGVL